MQISSIDWVNKLFYLHPDTVVNGFDAWEAFTEARVIQQLNLNNDQNYPLFIRREGKAPKGGGRFTARYCSFLPEWRAVPVDVDHKLELLVEMISDDALADAEMFDRTAVPSNVDIDPTYSQVEIIEVGTTPASDPVTPDDIVAAMLAVANSFKADCCDEPVIETPLFAATNSHQECFQTFNGAHGIIAGSAPNFAALVFQAESHIQGIVDADADKIYHTVDTNNLYIYRGNQTFQELCLGPEMQYGSDTLNFALDNSGNFLTTVSGDLIIL